MTGNKAVRYHEIDLLKGLGCALMLVGHAVRVKMDPPGGIDKVLLHIMDFSGPIFFFVSGMNVMTFLERNGDKPGFKATRFYLAAAAVLFLLGYTYNINRLSPFMEIFQCVAICTAAVYLLMRLRLPTWAHFIIMGLLYALYLVFRIGVEVRPEFEQFRALREAIPLGTDISSPGIVGALRELHGQTGPMIRMLFVHFSLLPWITFFYTGALCYRSLKADASKTKYWLIFFIALFVVSPFLARKVFPYLFLATYLDLMLRGIPSYVTMTLGGAGLLYLWGRKYYRGAQNYDNKIVRWLAARGEMLGKESFMFLIVHWWVISTILLIEMFVARIAESRGMPVYQLNEWVRAILTIFGTIFAVPWFAKLRDRWSQTNRYGTKIALIMVVSIILTFMFFLPAAPLALYFSYGASFGFAFIYPTLRLRLRRRYTTSPPATGA